MIVTIHQPDFLPWLGFFDRWQKSDLYIVLDDVQFLRRGWHHRDKIKTKDGVKWLTVPVIKKGKSSQLIREVRIDDGSDWRKKHVRTIEMNYKGAPGFERCFNRIREIYNKKYKFLIDLNMAFLNFVSEELGIAKPTAYASDYKISTSSSQRLLDLLKVAGGTEYLTGIGSKNYLDEALFRKEGIDVFWQEFEHPVYKQLHGQFIPMVSCIDFLMMKTTD